MPKSPITQLISLATLVLLNMSAFAQQQDYAYDSNGSLTRDDNKDITYTHYNHLNLVDTIFYEDGHKVVCTYTATGQKLKEQVLAANNTPVQTRGYFGNFLYLNNTLQEIQYEDGRAVPMLPGDNATPFERQYHIKDQVGSIRVTITSENDPVHYMATMESEQSAEEENLFEGLSSHRVTYVPANHTADGSEVARLPIGTADGVSLTLAVMNGDKLNLSVYAYYEGSSIDGDPAGSRNVMNTLLSVVESVLSGGASMLAEGLGAPGGNGNLNGLPGGVSTNLESVPVAHLNYQFLDKNRQFVNGGFVAVTENASFAHELLAINEVRVTQSGYLHVYLSNALTSSHEVYFDDLKIEHTKSIEVQSDDYDPLGLTLPEQHDERVGGKINRHLFSGKEQQDLDSSSYDFGARRYDAALGRWGAIDPMAEKYAGWSPYNYVMNNPVKFVDPDGRDIIVPYADVGGELKYYTFNRETLQEVPNHPILDLVKRAIIYSLFRDPTSDIVKVMLSPKKVELNVFPDYDPLLKGMNMWHREDGKDKVYWNAKTGFRTIEGYYLPPLVALQHELAHTLYTPGPNNQQDPDREPIELEEWAESQERATEKEKWAIKRESDMAVALGKVPPGKLTRYNYGRAVLYRVSGPISSRPDFKNFQEAIDYVLDTLKLLKTQQ